MSSLVKPVAELPLRLVALDAIDHRDVLPLLLASIPAATSVGTAAPLEQARRRPFPFTEIEGWQHGGLNE